MQDEPVVNRVAIREWPIEAATSTPYLALMRRCFALVLFFVLPSFAGAHPHIFIEAALRVVSDEKGQLEAVEVTWTYDDLYSLLILEDKGLDPDFDGVLTAQELEILAGFDLSWVPEFAGDTYLSRDGTGLELGPPSHLETRVENGRITTRHRRTVSGIADGVTAQLYDPTFYTAYELLDRVEVTGGCWAVIAPADIDAAYTALEELLFNTPERDLDADFPAVGASFADTVSLKC